MKPAKENVARPEGYSSTEKLISWARMGWRHVGLFAFPFISIMSVMVLGGGMDQLMWPQLFLLDKGSNLWVARFEPWIREYPSYVAVPFLLVAGFAVDRFGRTVSMLATLVIALGATALAGLGNSPTYFVLAYGMVVNLLYPLIFGISFIFIYESTPLKYRLIALLCISLAENMGSLILGLATTEAEGLQYDDPRWEGRISTIYIVAAVAIALSIALGLIFTMGRDTILSMVNCTGTSSRAYDLTVAYGRKNTTEPVPLSREEYIGNAQVELAECPSLCSTLKGSMIGPFCIMVSAGLINAITTKYFLCTYWSVAVNYFGGEDQASLIEMMLCQHGLTMFGVLVAIALYVWIKDIRFVPAVGYLLVALGCVICSSVKALDENGNLLGVSTMPGALTASLGACLIVVSALVSVSAIKIMIMDVFPTSCRGRGVFVFVATEYLFMGIEGMLYNFVRQDRWVSILQAAIVAAVGVGVFAAFYLTNWFDKSILFRDPELDACWLISSKLTNTIPVVGSRDKLRSPMPNTASTSSSAAAAPMSF